MAVESVVINGTTPNDGTAHTFTSSGFGTPQAALVYISSSTSASNPNTEPVCLSFGMWDGTNQKCVSGYWEDAQGVQDAYFWQASDKIGAIMDSGTDGTNVLEADYTISSTTDGVSIAISTDNTSDEYNATVVLFKGLTNVSLVAANSSPNFGFRPDLCFTMAHTANNGNTGGSSFSQTIGVGLVHADSSDTITQGFVSITALSKTRMENYSKVSTANCSERMSTTGDWAKQVSAVTSTGFTTTGDTSRNTFWLAFELDDPDDATVGTFTSATTATTKGITGVGFKPSIVGVFNTANTALSTETREDAVLHVGVAATTEGAVYTFNEDDVGDSNTEVGHNTAFIDWSSEVGTIDSFDSDGFTVDFTTADSGAVQYLYWAIKEVSTAPTLSLPTVTSVTDTTATVGCTVTF
jgi:hypothetical protein